MEMFEFGQLAHDRLDQHVAEEQESARGFGAVQLVPLRARGVFISQ